MPKAIFYPAYVSPVDAPAAPPETIELDKWAQPQQSPVKHRRFAAELTGRTTGFAVETIIVAIGQAQPTIPTPHRRYRGFVPDISQPLEPTLFQVAEEVTQDKWGQPQQRPIPHRRHQPSPSVTSGIEPTLLNAFTQNLAWAQPQADPQPLKGRQVWLQQFTRGYDSVEFVPPGVFDPGTGFAWPTQQAPVRHKRFSSPSIVVSGTVPTLLEPFTQSIAWAQPQALPQPIRHRKPWLDQYVRGPTEAEFTAVFDAATFAFPPQNLPVRHKRYQGWQGVAAGTQTTLLDPFSQNISWVQPQQPPVPHRFYRPATRIDSGIEPSLLEAFTQNLAWAQPQHDPLPIAKRNVHLDQFTVGLNPNDFLIFGTLCVCAMGYLVPGAQAWQIFVPGADESQGFVPGSQAAQGGCGC